MLRAVVKNLTVVVTNAFTGIVKAFIYFSTMRIQSPVVDDSNKMLRYLLAGLCEKVYNGPNTVELRDSEIGRIRLLIRP